MRTALIKIGNSQGIRIPKPILQQCDFHGEVELEIRNRELIIRAVHRPRHDWDLAFARMAAAGDDVLSDADRAATSWDNEEWEWT